MELEIHVNYGNMKRVRMKRVPKGWVMWACFVKASETVLLRVVVVLIGEQ